MNMQTRKAGRPRAVDPLNQSIRVRLSLRDLTMLEKAAQLDGFDKLSPFVRRILTLHARALIDGTLKKIV